MLLWEEPPPRYQDLSRRQAYAVEARTILRLFPLLRPRAQANSSELQNYFSNLIKFVDLLADIGLGNRNLEEVVLLGRKFDTCLKADHLFNKGCDLAVAGIRLVTDAVGQLNLVHYSFTSDLERDHRNPDLAHLAAGGGLALKSLGMQETIFLKPVSMDCDFVFQEWRQSTEFVSELFFARTLWPDMPFGVEHVIIKDWQEDMGRRGLHAAIGSFEASRNGVHLRKINRDSENKERVMTVNNVTLNFANGSSFTGPFAVGENIRIAHQAAANTDEGELKTRLDHLLRTVGALTETVEKEDHKMDVSSQLKTFVEEAGKENPSKGMLKSLGNGIIEVAKETASMIPTVTEAVNSVLDLFK